MRCVAFMLALGCGGCGLAFGQGQEPAPNPMPDFGREFQLPAIPDNGNPQFTLQIPKDGLPEWMVPQRGSKHAPGGALPIPGTWPDLKFEPIPTAWPELRMLPVTGANAKK